MQDSCHVVHILQVGLVFLVCVFGVGVCVFLVCGSVCVCVLIQYCVFKISILMYIILVQLL